MGGRGDQGKGVRGSQEPKRAREVGGQQQSPKKGQLGEPELATLRRGVRLLLAWGPGRTPPKMPATFCTREV